MKPRDLGFVVAAVLNAATAGAAERDVGRLPRAEFDVIPPGERIMGMRGDMTVWQTACRIGPTPQARRRIVDIAVQEWLVMGSQIVDFTQVETHLIPPGLIPQSLNPALEQPRLGVRFPRIGIPDSDFRDDATIGGYWSATPEGRRIVAEQNRAWNAPGGDAVGWVEPWSAAFISWVMCEAGLGDPEHFRRSAAHITYIDQAIRARDGMASDAAYVAYDAGEAPMNPGDLLCNSRDGTPYENLAQARESFGVAAASHCDVVVKLDEREVLVIGGNVQSSVSLTIVPLRRDGAHYLRPVAQSDIPGARRVFAHLKLRADPIERNAIDNSPAIRALARTCMICAQASRGR